MTRIAIIDRADMNAEQASVYDAAGRKVRDLWNGFQVGGTHTLPWDGRNDQGIAVPEGVYFVKLSSAEAEESRKIQVVR